MTVFSIKSAWKWEIDIIFQMLIGKSVTHSLMRLTSVVLSSWISSITSKISWIVGWPWSNHVCVCVCECASVSICNRFYKLIHWPQKQILVFFFVRKFGFWPGEVTEKSWNFFMMTSSNGNIFRVTGICAWNSPVPGEVPAQRPVMQSFDVYFDLRPKKRLSK